MASFRNKLKNKVVNDITVKAVNKQNKQNVVTGNTVKTEVPQLEKQSRREINEARREERSVPSLKTSVREGSRRAENEQKRQEKLEANRQKKVNFNKAKTGENKDLINADFKAIDKLYEDTRTDRNGNTTTHRKAALNVDETARKKAITNKISTKYGLTENEVDELYRNYNKQETTKRKAENAQKNTTGKIAGTIGAWGDNLISAATAIPNLIQDQINYRQGEDVTADDASHYFSNSKNATREAVRDTIQSEGGKKAYDIANMVGDIGGHIGAGMLTGGGSWIPSLLSAGQETERSMVESLGRGADVKDATKAALARGVTQAALNKIGFRDVPVNSFWGALGNAAGNAITEGAANAVQEGISYLTDDYFLGDKATQNEVYNQSLRETENSGLTDEERQQIAKDASTEYMMRNALQSAGQGAIFGGLMSASRSVPQLTGILKANKAENQHIRNMADLENAVEAKRQERADLMNQTPEITEEPVKVENQNPVTPEITEKPVNSGIDEIIPTEKPLSGEEGKSRVVTNSAVNANVITQEMLDSDPVIQSIARYAKSSNNISFENAQKAVTERGGELLDEYITDRRPIDNEQDVDQSMLLLRRLSDQLDNAPEGSDVSGLTTQRNLLLSRLRKAGTEGGQFVQAFAKWNDTAEGALINGKRLDAENTRMWESTHQKDAAQNKRTAEALERIREDNVLSEELNDPDYARESGRTSSRIDEALNNGKARQPKTHEQIRAEVENSIRKSLGDKADQFNDNDYEFLTSLVENKTPASIIADEIEHKLKNGEWYTIDESLPEPKPTNKKLQNALNSLVQDTGTKPVKEPPTLQQLETEVRNTLEKEYSSLDNFSDEDISYLANLINEGATKQELADALNTKLASGHFDISEATQERVNELFKMADYFDPDSKEAVTAKAEAYRLIAEEVVGDASPLEKFESWRYLAMLGNPKTMIRNYLGNKAFGVVTGVSNNFSALLEEGTDRLSKKLGGEGIRRTKAILDPVADDALIKKSAADGDAYRYREISGTKYEKNTKDAIKNSKSVFNSKLVKLYERATDAGISDYNAVKKKYSTSLAGYLKANGYDESIFDADNTYRGLKDISRRRLLTNDEKVQMENARTAYDTLEKAREYALKQAEYATFHEDNAVAKALTEFSTKARNSDSKAHRALGYMVEGVIPYKKTPANILRSIIDFSPFGAIDSIRKTGKLIYENTGKRKGNLADTYTKKSKFSGNKQTIDRTFASDVIDSWSKTLTGSGMTLLGYYLANKGILNSSKKGEKYQDQLEGKQNYSVTINGKTYTIDWGVPGAVPLLVGAELQKIKDKNAISDQKWYENIDDIVATINTIIDPLIETSMMQGVQDTLEAATNATKYSDDSGAIGGVGGAILTNTLTGYLTQGVPTLLGQIARTVDPYRRATDTATDQEFLGGIEKQGRKMMNKIPFLSTKNHKYRDAYGRTQKNSPFDNPVASLAYQMMSPAYIADIKQEDADISARDVYNSLDAEGKPIQDSDVFAAWKNKVNVGGQKLSPEEMEKYRTVSGRSNLQMRNMLANDEMFNSLSPEDQNTILQKMNTLVDKIGKEAAGYPQSNNTDLKNYKKYGTEGYLEYLVLGAQLKEHDLDNSEKNREALKNGELDILLHDAEVSDQIRDLGLNATAANKKIVEEQGIEALAEKAELNNQLEEMGLPKSEKNREKLKNEGSSALIEEVKLGETLKENNITNNEKNREQLKSEGEGFLRQKLSEQELKEEYGVYGDNAMYAYNHNVPPEDIKELSTMEVYPGKYADYRQYTDLHNTIPKIVAKPSDFQALYGDINTYDPGSKSLGQKDLLYYLQANDPWYYQALIDTFFNSTDKQLVRYDNGTYAIVK